MTYPEYHHIGFKIVSTFFMYITINQNNEKLILKNKKIQKLDQITYILQKK
jgi:hypothetical protein